MIVKPHIAIVIGYILVTHLILPTFFNGNDFLFFTQWKLFASNTEASTFDISWVENQERKFLLKDFSYVLKAQGIDALHLRKWLSAGKIAEVRELVSDDIFKLCGCEAVDVIQIVMSRDQYVFSKKNVDFSILKTLVKDKQNEEE